MVGATLDADSGVMAGNRASIVVTAKEAHSVPTGLIPRGTVVFSPKVAVTNQVAVSNLHQVVQAYDNTTDDADDALSRRSSVSLAVPEDNTRSLPDDCKCRV